MMVGGEGSILDPRLFPDGGLLHRARMGRPILFSARLYCFIFFSVFSSFFTFFRLSFSPKFLRNFYFLYISISY